MVFLGYLLLGDSSLFSSTKGIQWDYPICCIKTAMEAKKEANNPIPPFISEVNGFLTRRRT
jgi:hypothetical protein